MTNQEDNESESKEDVGTEAPEAEREAIEEPSEAPPATEPKEPASSKAHDPHFSSYDEEDEDEDDDDSYRRDSRRSAGRSSRRSGFEGLFRDSIKKAVERGLEVGIGTLKSADSAVRNVADEVKLPKEISNYLFSQIDETKNVLIKAVAGEVRTFLDSTDIATELQRALTALAFEIRMEVRFIPNEKGELKPNVKARAAPRTRKSENKRGEEED